jgi:polyisoprenyl-phosphate glycosyltransferase
MNPQLSIIIPIYNEEETLQEMYRRMKSVMDALVQEGVSAELILVDDGSRDRSLMLMRELHQDDSRVCYLSFARNFGHQIAVTAGLNF